MIDQSPCVALRRAALDTLEQKTNTVKRKLRPLIGRTQMLLWKRLLSAVLVTASEFHKHWIVLVISSLSETRPTFPPTSANGMDARNHMRVRGIMGHEHDNPAAPI